jgi:YtfJ family uncharacterized protein
VEKQEGSERLTDQRDKFNLTPGLCPFDLTIETCDKRFSPRRRSAMKDVLRMLIALVFVVSLVPAAAWAGAEVGQVPPKVELKDNLGGRLDGKPWSSDELKGKVHVLFYVDPDEKDTNNETSEALDKQKFSAEKFQSVAIINMAATFMPNFLISSSLKEKQEKYPRTLYLRDYKKALVQQWKLADDSSDIVAFDKSGKVIFRKDGKLTPEEIQKLLTVIKANL